MVLFTEMAMKTKNLSTENVGVGDGGDCRHSGGYDCTVSDDGGKVVV